MPARTAAPADGSGAPRDSALRHVGGVLVSLAILLGLLALVGWVTGSELLKSTIPGEATMKPNTAVAIVLLGLGTLSLGVRHRPAPGYAAAAAAAMIGAVTLAEHLTGWNPGFDTLLFSDRVDAFRTSAPGRMAPNSAAAFVLCGVALLSWPLRIGRFSICNGLLLATSAVGLLALIGYSADVQDLFGISATVTSMALPTATAVLLLGAGGLLLRPEHGMMRTLATDGADGAALRVLVPVTISVPLVVGLLISRMHRAGMLEAGVGFWLRNIVLIGGFLTVALLLSRRLGVVDRQRRAHQRELEQRTSDLAVISEATRRLARTTESERARELVCEVALDVTGAPLAALLEPAGDGRGLKVTARIGGRDAAEALEFRDGSGEAEAFIRRSRVFDPDGERLVVEGLGSVLGVTARSALWQPVLQDGQSVGVIAIGWEERPEPPSAAKLEALEAVAADAAVAIDRAALLVRLDAMARTDELTGLHNRRAWEEELARERSRSARAGEPLCVAMIDLDNFKAYNDEHGHQAGDRFLREASAAWKSALRLIDVIARYGGEEFGILLPNCSLANAEQLLERLRDLTPDGATASCGLAEWDGTETGAEVVGRADAALYEAKRSGRDRTITASAASDQH